jgi:hypothetical protein
VWSRMGQEIQPAAYVQVVSVLAEKLELKRKARRFGVVSQPVLDDIAKKLQQDGCRQHNHKPITGERLRKFAEILVAGGFGTETAVGGANNSPCGGSGGECRAEHFRSHLDRLIRAETDRLSDLLWYDAETRARNTSVEVAASLHPTICPGAPSMAASVKERNPCAGEAHKKSLTLGALQSAMEEEGAKEACHMKP